MNMKKALAAAAIALLLLFVVLKALPAKPTAPAATPEPAVTETPAPTPSLAPTATPAPTDTPAPTSAPEPADPLLEMLLRLDAGYDPAVSGAVVSLRWASRLMDAYAASGAGPAAASESLQAVLSESKDPGLWAGRLEQLERAARRICSGEVEGLISEHHAADDPAWTESTVNELFAALNAALAVYAVG